MAQTAWLKSALRDSKTIRVPLGTGGVTEGEFAQLGSGLIVFPLRTITAAEIADEAAVATSDYEYYTAVYAAEEIEVTKDTATADTYAQGAPVYLALSTGKAETADATGRVLIGHAAEAAVAADTTVKVIFNGQLSAVG